MPVTVPKGFAGTPICDDCAGVGTQADLKTKRKGSKPEEASTGFLALLSGLYMLSGVLCLIGGVVAGIMGLSKSGGPAMIGAAVALVLAAFTQFGLAEAGRVLVVLEKRTRPK
jgi:hypothetical protein